jgi:pimeloyl-ACP methyl ester carboxylesterase
MPDCEETVTSAQPLTGRALERRDPDTVPTGLVLMLHGGTQHSLDPVGSRSASLRRTQTMRNRIAPQLLKSGRALWLLRYDVRGWNADSPDGPSPVPDARWALDQVRTEYGDLPVVLLGHSMGGRTSAHVADDPNVVGVVALAPWFERGDPVEPLAGKHLVTGHGARDRITSARATRSFVRRAADVAAQAEFHDLGLAGHYMLYRAGMWNRFALRHSAALLERAGG